MHFRTCSIFFYISFSIMVVSCGFSSSTYGKSEPRCSNCIDFAILIFSFPDKSSPIEFPVWWWKQKAFESVWKMSTSNIRMPYIRMYITGFMHGVILSPPPAVHDSKYPGRNRVNLNSSTIMYEIKRSTCRTTQ